MPERDARLYTAAIADGRAMLRTLREVAGLSQMEVAGRASEAEGYGSDDGPRITQGHLNKIESGAIKQPTASTLDAILTSGLNVPYRVRIDVLAAFGYRLQWELPTEREIELELRVNAGEFGVTIWPAYMIDYAQRLWGWNRLFPRLLGNTPDNPINATYRGLTMLDILLNPAVGTNRQIANSASFTPVIVTWFKLMTKQYWQESWFLEFMAKARQWPGFQEMWDQVPEGPEISLVEHSTVPIEIQVPNVATPMCFRPVHVPMWFDPRFAILHLVPLDVETQAVCAAWLAEDAVG